MKVINNSKKTTIAKDAALCTTIFSKSLGLMFRLKPKPLVFIFNKEKIIPLHMYFVFFPIDVIFLTKEKKVVEMKENFRPLSYYTPKNKASFIIELPINTIRKTKTRIGDNIKLI